MEFFILVSSFVASNATVLIRVGNWLIYSREDGTLASITFTEVAKLEINYFSKVRQILPRVVDLSLQFISRERSHCFCSFHSSSGGLSEFPRS